MLSLGYTLEFLEDCARNLGMPVLGNKFWLQRNFPTLARYYVKGAEDADNSYVLLPLPPHTGETIKFYSEAGN